MLHIISILGMKPELARENHPAVLTALQVAVLDRKPANINLIPPQSNGSTPLHYACLLGNTKVVEVLLRNGAEWTTSDGNNLLPEDYSSFTCDSKVQEFKRLCKEEASRRKEKKELRWAGRFAEKLELEREEETAELERLKKLEVQKELERKKKLEEEEELRKRQRK